MDHIRGRKYLGNIFANVDGNFVKIMTFSFQCICLTYHSKVNANIYIRGVVTRLFQVPGLVVSPASLALISEPMCSRVSATRARWARVWRHSVSGTTHVRWACSDWPSPNTGTGISDRNVKYMGQGDISPLHICPTCHSNIRLLVLFWPNGELSNRKIKPKTYSVHMYLQVITVKPDGSIDYVYYDVTFMDWNKRDQLRRISFGVTSLCQYSIGNCFSKHHIT